MHSKSNRLTLSARNALAALLVLAATVTIEPQQASRNSDLDRIRGDIARMKTRLDELRKKTQTAEQEVESAQLEVDVRSRELELAIEAQAVLESDRLATERQIGEIIPKIDAQRAELRKRLAALYRLGRLSYVRLFLDMEQRDPTVGLSMLSYLVEHDARVVAKYQETTRQLTIQRQEFEAKKTQLAQVRRDVEARRREVVRAYRQKEKLLASLRVQASGSELQLAELEEKATRLERLLTLLASQKGAMIPKADVREVRGALAWPVKGAVIERFGRQRNPKFATVTNNNGIRIAAPAGTPVEAVFQGTVLFSQWFKGYGNLIILDHGNRVFSLYGNVKAPAVAVGDLVTTGQPIAGVGESEEAAAGHLYFEVRQNNRPEDPQKWLR